MNELVQQTIESGLMSYFERRTKRIMQIKDFTKPNTNIELSANSVSVKDLHFLFILYMIGVSASIIVLVLEILVSKYKQVWRYRA